MYYIYKNKYNKKINGLDRENKKNLDYKKLRLSDDYEYPSEEETSTKSDELKLPKWIKVNKTRFNEILSTITEAKNNGLKANVDGEEITLDKAESLLKGINSKKINEHEFREKYNDIVDDVEKILKKKD